MVPTGFAGAAFGSPVVVLTGPWTYRLSYGKAMGGKLGWQENWTNAQALPEVVRLEILDGVSGRQVVTPLLVPLRVDAEIRCDPGEGSGCGGGTEQQGETDLDGNGNGSGEANEPPPGENNDSGEVGG
jgi:hypothetical protein